MAQGLGAKAKKIFTDMNNKSNKDEYVNSSFPDYSGDLSGLDFMKLFGENPGETGDFSKFPEELQKEMFQLIKGQFTKAAMLPVMKRGVDAYTIWMLENRSKLSEENQTNHLNIYVQYQKIVKIYENEKESDSVEKKEENAFVAFTLMMGAAKYGSPPGSVAQTMGFSETGPTFMDFLGSPEDYDFNDCVIS